MRQGHFLDFRAFRLRYSVSFFIWLALPSITLLVFRSSRWEPYFRARPYNNSYDAMFIAAMAGIGLTSFWALVVARRQARSAAEILPAWFSWLNGFIVFEVMLSGCLVLLNFMAGAPATALVWALAFLSLLVSTVVLQSSQRESVFVPPQSRGLVTLLASALLIAFAALFIAFPVLKPWSGPPEPFVRWHPFGLETELLWRGIFLSFAAGMLITASDPAGRHRLFMVALVLSGYLHAAEMCADNLRSASMGNMNGNPEHLYGDVLGWFVIASLSLLFLKLSAPRKHSSAERN
ncbi:MAG TPA: hypothetical protein VMT53_18370 [Terriglobales bacterium]|nr:hypothetical protein [Terriglobales bacterium]